MTANELEGAGGSLMNLRDSVVNYSGTGTPDKGSEQFNQLFLVLNHFTVLYNVLKDIQFVDVRITASTIEGNAPLAVNFSSVGSLDPSGITITDSQIEWDLDGDGDYRKGDLNDNESKVSKAFADERNYHLLEQLHTLPSVGYLTKVRNKEEGESPA